DEDETRPRKGRMLQPGETFRVPMSMMDELQRSIAAHPLARPSGSPDDSNLQLLARATPEQLLAVYKRHTRNSHPSAQQLKHFFLGDTDEQNAEYWLVRKSNKPPVAQAPVAQAPVALQAPQAHIADQQPSRQPEHAFHDGMGNAAGFKPGYIFGGDEYLK